MRRSVAAASRSWLCWPAAPPPFARPAHRRRTPGLRRALRFPAAVRAASLSFIAGDQTAALIDRLVGDGLVDRDAAMKPVPRLASSWEFSPDGRRLTSIFDRACASTTARHAPAPTWPTPTNG